MRRPLKSALASTIVLALATASLPASAKDPIQVTLDRAKVMRISAPADAVILGNPSIADATIFDRQTIVITGRMAGITNLVILDAKGQPIVDEVINVEKAQAGIVVVQRGSNRYSYFCTPTCGPAVEPGDANAHFTDGVSQVTARNGLSATMTGAAAAPQ